jgi:DeoR/GlpR family transcriptional regulator of sugar metabolism
MIRIERQAKILQIIREREFIENSELTRIFNVTIATIRADLKALNEQGLVQIDHGGTSVANRDEVRGEPLYETKIFVNHDAKQAIGKTAATLVHDGDVVILDSGTTNFSIARSLRINHLKKLTVVTCDMMVAKELGSDPDIDVILLGGKVRKSYYSTCGIYTESILKNLHANKFFLGIDGANQEYGITNIILEEVPIKKLQIEISDEVILVADSTKFGKTAIHRVCMWNEIDKIITDNCICPEYLTFFETHNIPVLPVSLYGGSS